MNKIADTEKFIQKLIIENNKLSLKVEVYQQQIQLQLQHIEHLEQKTKNFITLDSENITLRRDILNLLEIISKLEEEKNKIQEQQYIEKIEEIQLRHQQQISELKTLYEDKVLKIQKEKTQILEQTAQMALYNQTSKNLEQQAAKIITISHKLEKTLQDIPSHSSSQSHIGISKEMYDQMIEQLKSKSTKNIILETLPDQQFYSQRYKKPSVLNFKREPQFNIKKIMHIPKPVDSPRTQQSQNPLTLSTLTKKS